MTFASLEDMVLRTGALILLAITIIRIVETELRPFLERRRRRRARQRERDDRNRSDDVRQ